MSHQRYDLAVVGAGTAGLEIAKNASRSGLKVCLIEQGYSEGKSYLNKIPLLSGSVNPASITSLQPSPSLSKSN